MALCFIAWGFFYLGLHRRGISYTEHFEITTLYFVCVGILIAALFWREVSHVVPAFSIIPFVFVAAFLFALILISIVVPKYVRTPVAYFTTYPDRYYLKLDWRRVISKSADIAAQQVFIVVLVVGLKDAGLTLPVLILYFFLLFALLHVPLIASERGRWPSLVFAGAVVAFSLLFPPLILFVPYGFIYTFLIHWIFYMTLALTFYFTHSSALRE